MSTKNAKTKTSSSSVIQELPAAAHTHIHHTMPGLSQRQQGNVPTPLSAIDDSLANDLMLSLPAYRARARAASSSAISRGGGGDDDKTGVSPSSPSSPSFSIPPPRGATHAQQWKPALDRRQSFDPQVRKHEQQQHHVVEKQAVGVLDGGFTEKD